MSDIQTWLDRGKALVDKATEGPWEARSSEATMNDRSGWKIGKHNHPQVLRSVMRGDDAVFIADARTRLPQALNALQAVLDLHKPSGFDGTETCAHCTVIIEKKLVLVEPWPCSTVQAIHDALGAES